MPRNGNRAHIRKEMPMTTKPEFILRDTAGVHLLMSVGAKKDAPLAMRLNDTAAVLFTRLSQGDCDEAMLVHALMSEYDVEEDVALRDTRTFLDALRRIGALAE